MYEKFIDFYAKLVEQPSKLLAEEDAIKKWTIAFQKDLLLWGSRDVILEYAKFKGLSGSDGKPHKVIFVVDSIMRAMREDLGLSCRKIPKGGLISMWLTDPENLSEG